MQKPKVKAYVMPDNGIVSHKFGHFIQHIQNVGRFADHRVRDVCELCNSRRDRTVRIDEGLVGLQNLAAVKADHSDFNDLILPDVQSGRFQIQCHHAHIFVFLLSAYYSYP